MPHIKMPLHLFNFQARFSNIITVLGTTIITADPHIPKVKGQIKRNRLYFVYRKMLDSFYTAQIAKSGRMNDVGILFHQAFKQF